ncbi:phage tail tape measure protein [Streptomyces sp. NBC_01571]|uniref:phage tail tape measure protein n=1 Tax=Streptomyces sp. NBC_01571 TaxID=2975883 RepID=UPI002259B532|nr:phage tail tape measure protein [Streptomyces sp. NBC_01571]MCX4573090.1 phage tail tape measure protein [Streptomyces sp. NBC_01571]
MATTSIKYDLIARDSASRTFDKIGRSASTTEKVFGRLGKAAMVAGAAVAGGLAAGLAKGTKDAIRFQAEMTRISTQAGGTAKDVKVLSDQVLKLGTSTQQGPQHLAESLYHLKSVGMDNVQAMKALKESSDLAAVGHANLEETTNALAGAWRTGIKGATSFHEAVSTVNAIIGAGNMSMDQFNAAIGTGILPSAKTFGLSMKQVGAALALMTDEGIDSASAATRLRMSFSLLGAPSKAAEKQLGKIHLTGLQLADAMRGPKGLIGAIGLLKEHLDKSGMSASKQSQLLSRAFGGGRSSSGILLMLNNLDVLEKKQEQINHSAGKFDDAVKMQRKTAEAQWHLLTSNLEVMGIRVGTKVLPVVTDFVHFLATTAMPAAAGFGKVMRDLIPVGAIKRSVGEAQSTLSGFFSGLTGGKSPTAMLGDFMDGLSGGGKKGPASPKGPLVALTVPQAPRLLAKPQKAVSLAPKAPALFKQKSDPGMLAIPKAAKAAMSPAEKLGKQLRDAVSSGIGNADFSKMGAQLGTALGKAFQWIAKNAGKLTKQLADALGGLDWVDIGKQVGGKSLGFAIGFITSFGTELLSPSFWKKHWWDTVLAALSFIGIGKLAGPLEKVISKIPILKIFAPVLRGLDKLGGPFSRAFDRVAKFFGSHAWAGFAKVFPEGAKVIEEEAGVITTRIGVWGIKLMEKGKGAAHLLGTGISKGFGWVTSKAAELAALVLKPFVKASGWLVGKGRGIAIGLKDGVVRGAKGLGGWIVDHMVTPVTSRFSRAGSWLVGKGSALVSGFKSGAVGGAKAIGSWTSSHIISPVTSRFSKAGTWLTSKGSALISGFKSGVVGTMKGIGGWIKKTIVDPVVGAVKKFFGIRSPSRVFMSIGGHLVSGLIKGMAKTNGTSIAKRIFGSLPKALGSIVKKGLVSVTKLPGKALKALGGLGGDLLGLLGLGGSGGGSSANQKIGQALAAARGWSGPQWAALKNLWNGESGWNERALNKSSGAYGIPQSLPASKMASAGGDWKTNASTQIKWGMSYIASRYGNPVNAYSQWLARSPHWYAKGTGGAARGLAWVGEKGPELVNFKGGEDVLSNPQSMAFAKANGIKLPGYASGTILNAADRVHRDRQRVEDAKNAVASAKRRHKGVAAAETRLRAAQKELAAANIALKNAQRSAKTSIANTIATGLSKTLSTGTSAAIASAVKSLATKLLNAGFKGTAANVQKKGGQLQSLATKKASIASQIAAANQYATDQAGGIKDFLAISGTSAMNIGDLISQSTAQQKTAGNFVALSKSLKARGASKDLLQQLSDAGPGSQLASILGAKNVTTADIGKLNSLMASGGKLATSFGRDMADLMYDSGKDASKGFLAGLKSQEAALAKQMAKLAKDLITQIKKALKIKSPSGVMRDEVGKNVVLGMVHGMDMHGHLVGSAAQRLADTASGVSVRRRYVPTQAGQGRGGPSQDEIWARLSAAIEASGSEVHVRFNDDRLRDLIEVTVQPKIKAATDRQAHRANVGRRSAN